MSLTKNQKLPTKNSNVIAKECNDCGNLIHIYPHSFSFSSTHTLHFSYHTYSLILSIQIYFYIFTKYSLVMTNSIYYGEINDVKGPSPNIIFLFVIANTAKAVCGNLILYHPQSLYFNSLNYHYIILMLYAIRYTILQSHSLQSFYLLRTFKTRECPVT